MTSTAMQFCPDCQQPWHWISESHWEYVSPKPERSIGVQQNCCPECMTGRKNRLEIEKKSFLEGLKNIPGAPKHARDARLRKLAYKYKDMLDQCQGDVPSFDLKRLRLPSPMSYTNFFYEVDRLTS